MPRTSEEIAAVVLQHLLEIHADTCSITQEHIAEEADVDQSMSEILAGLLLLHEDLRFREAERQRVEGELLRQNEELQESRSALASLAEELSTPIIKIWDGVLMLPIIGSVDSARASDLMERLLSSVVAEEARYVVLDLTGVAAVDTATADHFLRIVGAVQMLGAESVIAGVQPPVSMALASLGVDVSGITTTRNSEGALRDCIRQAELEQRGRGVSRPGNGRQSS